MATARRMRRCGTVPGPLRDHFVAKKLGVAALQPRALTAIFAGPAVRRKCPCPTPSPAINVRLYFEEAGSGTPIIFLHEFAADHTNWEPQMRYFSRGHRCIAYSARGYTPSDVPPSPRPIPTGISTPTRSPCSIISKIDRAHFVGLSMGSYSSLQIALNAPGPRAVDDAGRRRLGLQPRKPRCLPHPVPGHRRAIRDASAAAEVAKVTREAPGRIPFLVKDPRGHADFYAALARHDSKGSANTMRGFQGGRPSIYTLTEAIRKVPTPALIICGDEDDDCVEPSLFLKKHLPAAGLDLLPEVGPRAQSGRARAVQRDGRALHRAGRGRALAVRDRGRWRRLVPVIPRARGTHGPGSRMQRSAIRTIPRLAQSRNADHPATAFAAAALSRNTPCSPNMFQNHQGRLSRSGRP